MNKQRVIDIKRYISEGELTQKEIGALCGVSRSTVSDIACGRIHQDVPWPEHTSKELDISGRIGIVGDMHLPFTHPMYLRFVQDVFEAWQVDHVHFIGDIVDAHALGFWEHNPNGLSAESEADKASEELEHWVNTFPRGTVSIGNHDERHFRVARRAGLPNRYMRDFKEIWNAPGWDWAPSHTIDGVLYEHGTGSSGKDAAINRAMQKRCSLVMGHIHSFPGVKWHSNEFDTIFGMNVGCGIDCREYAFDYGRPFPIRPMLGCGVVLDGEYAIFEPMHIGRGQPYHRSNAG